MSDKELENVISNKLVSIVCFAIMPNHFHILLREEKEGGVIKSIQRVEIAYAKYFNTKYQQRGHVFQGAFRAVHVETNEQLLYTSAYIHRNPREINIWKNKEYEYPWSSLQDYLKNRWGKLLDPSIISAQFKESREYQEFVDTSGAKDEYEMLDFGSHTE